MVNRTRCSESGQLSLGRRVFTFIESGSSIPRTDHSARRESAPLLTRLRFRIALGSRLLTRPGNCNGPTEAENPKSLKARQMGLLSDSCSEPIILRNHLQ